MNILSSKLPKKARSFVKKGEENSFYAQSTTKIVISDAILSKVITRKDKPYKDAMRIYRSLLSWNNKSFDKIFTPSENLDTTVSTPNKTFTFQTSRTYLSQTINASISTVKRCLSFLEDLKLIKRHFKYRVLDSQDKSIKTIMYIQLLPTNLVKLLSTNDIPIFSKDVTVGNVNNLMVGYIIFSSKKNFKELSFEESSEISLNFKESLKISKNDSYPQENVYEKPLFTKIWTANINKKNRNNISKERYNITSHLKYERGYFTKEKEEEVEEVETKVEKVNRVKKSILEFSSLNCNDLNILKQASGHNTEYIKRKIKDITSNNTHLTFWSKEHFLKYMTQPLIKLKFRLEKKSIFEFLPLKDNDLYYLRDITGFDISKIIGIIRHLATKHSNLKFWSKKHLLKYLNTALMRLKKFKLKKKFIFEFFPLVKESDFYRIRDITGLDIDTIMNIIRQIAVRNNKLRFWSKKHFLSYMIKSIQVFKSQKEITDGYYTQIGKGSLYINEDVLKIINAKSGKNFTVRSANKVLDRIFDEYLPTYNKKLKVLDGNSFVNYLSRLFKYEKRSEELLDMTEQEKDAFFFVLRIRDNYSTSIDARIRKTITYRLSYLDSAKCLNNLKFPSSYDDKTYTIYYKNLDDITLNMTHAVQMSINELFSDRKEIKFEPLDPKKSIPIKQKPYNFQYGNSNKSYSTKDDEYLTKKLYREYSHSIKQREKDTYNTILMKSMNIPHYTSQIQANII